MGKIFYIMGKSASGKDKIYSRLVSPESGLQLEKLILYTTRPIRRGENPGVQYYFVDEDRRLELEREGRLIESRSYQTVHGVWTYFTADEGQIDLTRANYIGIGTLESYIQMKKYYGEDVVCPIYIQVEDGERLQRALTRERKQDVPRYAELCRRFLADQRDFSEENIKKAGIQKRFENVNLDDCIEEIAAYIQKLI